MDAVVEIIRDEMSGRLETAGIKWSQQEKLPEIKADRLSMIRTIRNLVDNALKYGGSELKEIRVGFRETERFHILSVSDDGVGIRTENPDRVFGPFRRVGVRRKTEGLGLGLAIVKEIADRHHGKVWIEPGPLEGASICVSFSKEI
jgi:light-regulated signal transduction histidine kinase (bacteriophytochrome)